MTRRKLFGGAAVFLSFAMLIASLSACKKPDIKIPLDVKGAKAVGSLHLEVVYDPSQYALLNVEKGKTFSDALFEYDAASPGHVVIGMISGNGINGDGTLAVLTLQVKNKGEGRIIELANVVANSVSDLSELPVHLTPATTSGKTTNGPVIEFPAVPEQEQ